MKYFFTGLVKILLMVIIVTVGWPFIAIYEIGREHYHPPDGSGGW